MLNIHYLKNFIRHYAISTFVDVLHSPFVFELYEYCIKKQKHAPAIFRDIENVRTRLIKNKQTLNYTDYGANSKQTGFSKRVKVSTLARNHLKPARIAEILYYITHHYPYQNIIELGTSLGITTSYLATGAQTHLNAKLHTVEGCSDVHGIAGEVFKQLNLGSAIHSHLGNFNTVLPKLLEEINDLDLLFVDGNHTCEATLDYFNQCLLKAHKDSLFIFDDIYWSKGMTQAWEEIKKHPKVTVTVDLFFIGLVYFRTEQVKQDFKLRVI
ncbi:MAG: class I SAM-dependent methyltransferase [Bacteroidota bacterium]|nr:class I SAM-dependent methyltransferase [Bacteroidota bacterium]